MSTYNIKMAHIGRFTEFDNYKVEADTPEEAKKIFEEALSNCTEREYYDSTTKGEKDYVMGALAFFEDEEKPFTKFDISEDKDQIEVGYHC